MNPRRIVTAALVAAVAGGAAFAVTARDGAPAAEPTASLLRALDTSSADALGTSGTTMRARAAVPTATEVTVWFTDAAVWQAGQLGYLVPVRRTVAGNDLVAGTMRALFAGPTPAERARGLVGAPWPDATVKVLRVDQGEVVVQLGDGCVRDPGNPFGEALIRTLKGLPDVGYVKVLDAHGVTERPTYDVDSLPQCLDIHRGKVRWLTQLYDG